MARARKEANQAGRLVKLSVSVDVDTHRRLATLSLLSGDTIQNIVAGLIADRVQAVRLGSVSRAGECEQPAESTDGPRPRVVGL
jgi:hypothetical protein